MSAGATEGLAQIIGNAILGIRRIWYVLEGKVVSSRGALELTFKDGRAATLDVGPDGEALSVIGSRWEDPFTEPLSEENRAFVERSGKWTAFDVSTEPPYRELVGHTVERVEPLLTSTGKIRGATLFTSTGALRTEVQADDLTVDVVLGG